MAIRIVIDAMGGDHAPRNPVGGALAAIETLTGDFEVVLVGREAAVRPLLKDAGPRAREVRVVDAPEVIANDEPASSALRRKKGSSILVGLELLRDGAGDAFVSAGHTGAVMAGALMTLGRVASIARPAIVTIFPTQELPCLVLDVGANVDSKPFHLLQFAIMGHVCAVEVLGRERPRVGLLSIGEEPSKGDEVTVAAHRLLAESGLDFVGNVEGHDLLKGAVDVAVCDGFVGNVLLKFGESFVDFLADAVREEIRLRKLSALGAYLMQPAFDSLRRRLDYAEYGGAPLLGVDGIVVVAHGGSSVKAFRNAVRVARVAAGRQLNRRIEGAVRELSARTTPMTPVETAVSHGHSEEGP